VTSYGKGLWGARVEPGVDCRVESSDEGRRWQKAEGVGHAGGLMKKGSAWW
jgi:hypothetical protein